MFVVFFLASSVWLRPSPLTGDADFGMGYINPKTNKVDIQPNLLGFMNACYQLGTILAVPIAPWLNQRYGRRWSVMSGSLIMMVGAILQGFAQHGKSHRSPANIIHTGRADLLFPRSCHVYHRAYDPRRWYSVCHHRRFRLDRRAGLPKRTCNLDLLLQRILFSRLHSRCFCLFGYGRNNRRLGLATPVPSPNCAIGFPGQHCFVSLQHFDVFRQRSC